MNGTQKIRVLYLIDKLKRGGAQNHLLQVLRVLDRVRVEPFVCCLMEKGVLGEEIAKLGIHVEVLSLTKLYGIDALRGMLRLVRFLKKNNIQVLQTYLVSANIYGTIAGKLAGVPAIITSRRDMGFSRNWRLSLVEEWIINPMVTRIITVSRAVEEKTRLERGLKVEKLVTIPNGVNLKDWDLYKYDRKELREEWGISNEEKVVGVIANFSPVKGHEDFLQAARYVVSVYPKVRFLLVGEGSLRSSLQAYASRLDLDQNVIFTGSRSDISKILSLIDISVLPSRSEGMSNTLLESMAMAKPVITTAVGGNPELVLDGSTGILVPPSNPPVLAEAILKLLRDNVLSQNMGQKGRQRIEGAYDIHQTAKGMIGLYEEILK